MKLRPVTYTLDVNAIDAVLFPSGEVMRDKDGNVVPGREESPEMLQAKKANSLIRHSGFIAQEVEPVVKETKVDFSGVDVPQNDGDLYGLRYGEFVVPVVKAIQEQQEIISKQQKVIDELLQRISELEKRK